ncbi:MAG TPA: hypothetical protein VFC15_03830 [Candidatus Limnocylindrales bacterium]|jgi:hypothetical protein|nr:hypothetical protein [Candidatus Limnocylindrales bacterium]
MMAQSENKPATSQHFGRQSRAALRVAGRKSGENRWVRALYRGGSVTMASVGHVVHALWLEVTGFLFLVLAVIGAGATVREYHRYAAGTTTRGKVILAALFTLLFLYFGANSFWRTRRNGNRG